VRPDLVPPEVRAAEIEIDSAHRSNPLMRLSFGEAAWYFLAFCEERLVVPILKMASGERELTTHQHAALVDEVLNHAKWPLRWLSESCRRGNAVPRAYKDDAYGAAWDLSKLASEYLPFESAFTYASMNVGRLHIEDGRIVASGPFRDDTRYEAYDRQIVITERGEGADFVRIAELVREGVHINGDHFSYPLNPKIVRDVMVAVDDILAKRFSLPFDWALSKYSLGEFATLARCLWSLSAIHHVARLMAAGGGCPGLGYSRSLMVMNQDDLLRRLVRYTSLRESSVRAIVDDMTFGAAGVTAPDPALQPLVRLTDTQIGWAPTLFLTNAFERNLLVLLNRSPETRKGYLRLSTQKEELLRSRMTRELDGLGFRFLHGEVPGWKDSLDVDLAIVSDPERCCLLLELKSFLAPAEAREIHERGEDISRGISQVKRRRLVAKDQMAELCSALSISSDYELSWGVASETSIGAGWVQDSSVPVIRANHLVRQIIQSRRLGTVCAWLTNREYLPVEGRDYETVPTTRRIGRWTLDWHGIRMISAAGSVA